MTIYGSNDRGFARVREEFERNFAERGEVGAGVYVMVDGDPVVDLWGGIADPGSGRPWEKDTAAVVWSTTKGMTALAAHMLRDRGLIDFDAPVSRYWPEFAAAGKADIPVRMLLTHEAGMPGWRKELPPGGLYDWELCTAMLAEQEPFWHPGTQVGYHSIAFGYLIGEVIRRVAGRSVGRFVAEEIAQPLGADVWIGLPEHLESRVATSEYSTEPDDSPLFTYVMANPESVSAQAVMNSGGWFGDPGVLNSRASHAAEMPALGGIASARGLATMYAPLSLDGAIDGVRLVRPEAIAPMRYVQSRVSVDTVLRASTTYSLGFMKSWDNRRFTDGANSIFGEDAFGHGGFGGSIGFADPGMRLSFGYVMNKQGNGTGLNRRGQSLVDAVYQTLGATTDAPGFWARP